MTEKCQSTVVSCPAQTPFLASRVYYLWCKVTEAVITNSYLFKKNISNKKNPLKISPVCWKSCVVKINVLINSFFYVCSVLRVREAHFRGICFLLVHWSAVCSLISFFSDTFLAFKNMFCYIAFAWQWCAIKILFFYRYIF